jgi:hypothetical protein
MELTEQIKQSLRQTAEPLRGSDRRRFLARTVRLLDPDSQRKAERERGWDCDTIRKGLHELDSGIRCIDNFSARGRKRAEEHLPGLLEDVRALIDAQGQTDPTFHTQRLYTRLSAAEIRRQLILAKGYTDAQLPCDETIRQKMLRLGYRLRKVAKGRPKKVAPDRRHLRPTEASQRRGRRLRGHASAVAGRQGQRENRPVLPRRPHLGQGGGVRPRLQGGRQADSLRHPAAALRGVGAVLRAVGVDERLHRGRRGDVVAGRPGPWSAPHFLVHSK